MSLDDRKERSCRLVNPLSGVGGRLCRDVDGETADGVDVFVFNADGKVIKQQSRSDTATPGRAFGSK